MQTHRHLPKERRQAHHDGCPQHVRMLPLERTHRRPAERGNENRHEVRNRERKDVRSIQVGEAMKFEEFDFKRAAKSEKAMNAIANIVAATLWALMFIAIAWRL